MRKKHWFNIAIHIFGKMGLFLKLLYVILLLEKPLKYQWTSFYEDGAKAKKEAPDSPKAEANALKDKKPVQKEFTRKK